MECPRGPLERIVGRGLLTELKSFPSTSRLLCSCQVPSSPASGDRQSDRSQHSGSSEPDERAGPQMCALVICLAATGGAPAITLRSLRFAGKETACLNKRSFH
jgi:hypothetical protein